MVLEQGPELTMLRSRSLKERVLQQLRRLIEDGTFEPGARLPSERELSDRLEVSRGTVREAVALLAALGVVEVRHGRGSFVRSQPGASAVRKEWLEWTVRHSGRIRELLEVRRGLESFAAELAAQRRDDGHQKELADALHETVDATEPVDVPALVHADAGFHRAIYRATGNPILVELLDAIGHQLVRERATTWDIPGRPERSLQQHREIFNAICAGDPARARAAVLAHLQSIEDELTFVAQFSYRRSPPPTTA